MQEGPAVVHMGASWQHWDHLLASSTVLHLLTPEAGVPVTSAPHEAVGEGGPADKCTYVGSVSIGGA